MCGPASLKIVLGFYGKDIAESELAERTHTTKERGTTAEELARVARELGFCAEIKNDASFADIEHWLNKGVPPIVDWFTRGRDDYQADSAVPDGHYSVVCGLDGTHITLQDPELGGTRTILRELFERVWFDFSGDFIKPDELIVRQMIAIYPEVS